MCLAGSRSRETRFRDRVLVEETEVDELDVNTVVDLAVETEVDGPDVGAVTELVAGTGAGETEDGKSDFEATEAQVAVADLSAETNWGAVIGTSLLDATLVDLSTGRSTGDLSATLT